MNMGLGALATQKCELTSKHYGYLDSDHYDHDRYYHEGQFHAVGKSLRRVALFFLKKRIIKMSILGDLLLKVCYPILDLESRFYAVLSKAASKWPSVKTSPDRSPGTETAKGRESVRINRKDRNGVLLRLAGI